MFSGDVKFQLILLDKLAGAVLTLCGLFSRVLETENRIRSDLRHFNLINTNISTLLQPAFQLTYPPFQLY